jgi:NAD(P)-dependent dehydrogenase (short-subunit alcohol dehydrogenase family)
VIIGSAAGIGAATVRAFAAEGARVLMVDVDADRGAALAAELSQTGSDVRFQAGDQASERDVDAAIAACVDAWGRLDVVHANAGVGVSRRVAELPLADWQRSIDVNLTGSFLAARAALRVMEPRRSGSIVLTASPHAFATSPVASAYAASKAGILGLVRAVAVEAAAFDVRINAVVPGATDTPMVRDYAAASEDPEATLEAFADTHAIKRLTRPEEVAAAVVFLASDEASFTTGSALHVDGGALARLASPVEYREE